MIVQTSALRTWQGALPATCEQHYLVRGVFYWDDGFDFNPEFGDMDEDFTFEPGARWVSESRLLNFLGAMGNAEYDLKGQLLPMLMEHSYKSVSGTLQRARKNFVGSKALHVANCSLDGSHHCAKKADVCALLRAAVKAADDAADLYLDAPTDGRSRPAGEQQQMQESLADAEATYTLAACAAGAHGGVRGMLAAGAPVSRSPSGRAQSTTRKRTRQGGASASQQGGL